MFVFDLKGFYRNLHIFNVNFLKKSPEQPPNLWLKYFTVLNWIICLCSLKNATKAPYKNDLIQKHFKAFICFKNVLQNRKLEIFSPGQILTSIFNFPIMQKSKLPFNKRFYFYKYLKQVKHERLNYTTQTHVFWKNIFLKLKWEILHDLQFVHKIDHEKK